MTTATLENCLAQINELSKSCALAIEQNNEIHAANEQLLRQHKTTARELLEIKLILKANGISEMNKELGAVIEMSKSHKRSTSPKYGCKSLDGNTVLKKLAKEVETSYSEKNTQHPS